MKRTFIIAEAGVNYNADMDMALKMIRIAKSVVKSEFAELVNA